VAAFLQVRRCLHRQIDTMTAPRRRRTGQGTEARSFRADVSRSRYCRWVHTQRSRVTVIGLNYAPESTGVAPYTSSLARGLAGRKFEVRVLTTPPHYPAWRIRDGYGAWSREESLDGVAIRRLRHFVPARPSGLPRLASELSFGLRAVFSRWSRPDTIAAVSPALFASVLVMARARLMHRRVPTIVWVQDLYALGLAETGQGSGVVRRISHAVEGWLLRTADRVVVIHDRFASRIHDDFRVPRHRIEVVRNWTHLPPRPPIDVANTRRRFGWDDSETVVLHAGNMGRKQGLRSVIEAARTAQQDGAPLRFVLLGDGSERQDLERAGAGIQSLQFLRPLNDEAFAQALVAADVLLVNELPGVAEMAVPSKLTSYFAAGRPVLAATDVNGITADEVRAANAGVVIPAGDSAALVAAALDIRRKPEEAERFGQSGRAYRDSALDENHAIDQFVNLLKRVSA
jgi:colanic acid biosynthesis glycosyl transferase WcaI